MIEDVENAHNAKEISARTLHQKLSLLVRFFAFEVSGVRAQVLTLQDLKRTKLTLLAKTIEGYYPPEFEALDSKGSVANALRQAREVVSSWS